MGLIKSVEGEGESVKGFGDGSVKGFGDGSDSIG